jgi:glutamate racemase
MIALFDSGVGGLSILRAIRAVLPDEPTVYLADTANFPYGTKSEPEIDRCTLAAAGILMRRRPDVMVVACNSASTSALASLRSAHPEVPFVGVVPAIKPAAALTRTGTVAVLATARTLESAAYQELKNSWAGQVRVIDRPCPGWVEIVERGEIGTPAAREAVARVIRPALEQGADVFVLGCTHYPFLDPVIQDVAGPGASILDSGEAVARQVRRVLTARRPGRESAGAGHLYLATGDPEPFRAVAERLLGAALEVSRA